MNRTINDLNISTYNYKFESINIFDYGKFYFLATQKSFKGGANTYLKLRGSSEESSSNEWTVTLPDTGKKYKISGNFEKGQNVYLVFNNTNINDNSIYDNIVITPEINDSLLNQNIIGPELNNEKSVIDVGPKLMEKAKENNILNKKINTLNKNILSISGNIKFQIIVKDSNGLNSSKILDLENSVIEIN